MSGDRHLSKLLSFWLRHKPEAGKLSVDPTGWVEVEDVLAALAAQGSAAGRGDIERVVAQSDKNRFEQSPDGRLIRARQGHSIPVDLDWPVAEPPEFLFHGTVDRFLDAIMAEGLRPMGRHHVHLSVDLATANAVGSRRGRPVVLQVAAARLFASGQAFRLSGNGVWLTEHVPPGYLARL